MEDELKCAVCKQLFSNPVLLPCWHSLCLNCAVTLQQVAVVGETSVAARGGRSLVDYDTASATGSASEYTESDSVSLCSDNDSGVCGLGASSRPASYVPHGPISLVCPTCRKIVYFDENGAHNLPKYRVMQHVVEKFEESRGLGTNCQLCESDPKAATVMCDQCEVFYCDSCLQRCHPARGPLANHKLISAGDGKSVLRLRSKGAAVKCLEHCGESLTMYCLVCQMALCSFCLAQGRHARHDVQSLAAMCKGQKTELSTCLQHLSERAKTATEMIQNLKMNAEILLDSGSTYEDAVKVQIDALVEAIYRRRDELLEYVRQEKMSKVQTLKQAAAKSTAKLQKTTGLIQFSIEALKETDATAFLQVGNMLAHKVSNVELSWLKDTSENGKLASLVSQPELDLDLALDSGPLIKSIQQLHFVQMKPPGKPTFLPEDCVGENNCITVAWAPQAASLVKGYILEMDDGNGGPFKEVYCGEETVCTVDGLHFNSVYIARLKAFNASGEGPYSDPICLQTADVASFTLDPMTAHPEIILSHDLNVASCASFEHRVALGSLGFSRGVHFWEFTVDKYDGNADVVFGIARANVSKDVMLGKDDFGWSMYVDSKRSWFVHSDKHSQRVEGGICEGSTVGVLLDLNQGTLSFYINEDAQGEVAFHNLSGVFYPAVSLNRNASVTIHTALDPPSSHGSDSEGT